MACLDTDVLIAFMLGYPAARAAVEKLGREAKTSLINTCELYEGAFLAENREKSLRDVEGFLSQFEVLLPSNVSSKLFGEVVATLTRRGKRPSDFDALIAAIALTYGEPLVTRDEHFKEIHGLKVERW